MLDPTGNYPNPDINAFHLLNYRMPRSKVSNPVQRGFKLMGSLEATYKYYYLQHELTQYKVQRVNIDSAPTNMIKNAHGFIPKEEN